MKKILTVMIIIILILPINVGANFNQMIKVADESKDKILVFNFDDGRVIYNRYSNEKYNSFASKRILVAMIAYDILKDKRLITLSRESVKATSTMINSPLKVGESFNLEDMVAAMILGGGNDVVVQLSLAIAEGMQKDNNISVENAKNNLLTLIKEKLKVIGVKNTEITDIIDNDDESQYSTLDDEMKIMLHLVKYPKLMDILKNVTYKVEPSNEVGLLRSEYNLKSNNRFISSYDQAIGVDYKVYKNEMVTMLNLADKDSYRVGVLINSNSVTKTIKLTQDILNDLYSKSKKVKVLSKIEFNKIYTVTNKNKLDKNGLKILAKNDVYYNMPENEASNIEYDIIFDDSKISHIDGDSLAILKDLYENEEVGYVSVKVDKYEVAREKIITQRSISKSTFITDIIYVIFFDKIRYILLFAILLLILLSFKIKKSINNKISK